MFRGIYSSATGMITQQNRIDVMGNNISNINTDGFKSNEVTLKSFQAEMARRMTDDVPVGDMSVGVTAGSVSTDFSQGNLEQTGEDTDLGINGTGFFAVEAVPGGGGVKYTRDGNFSVDAQGYLQLSSGERLLGADGQPIKTGGNIFQTAADGTITENGTNIGKIQLYSPSGSNGISQRSDGFYDITSPAASGAAIMQGYIENSNVDDVNEMTGMMEATQSFQSCQQAFQVNIDSLDKLINQAGSLKS